MPAYSAERLKYPKASIHTFTLNGTDRLSSTLAERRSRLNPAQNEKKHGVSFVEAASVFLDVDYLLAADREAPRRFVALGYSSLARMLVVVHFERGKRLRIISARTANRSERQTYERRKKTD